MTITTLYLPAAVKERAEDFLRQNNPRVEHGGYFLGQDHTILVPRFYPNRSDHPERQYRRDACAVDFVRLDAQLFGMDLFVDFHTHPNHSITSEQDLKYSAQQPLAKLNVMIAYDPPGDKFTWHAYDNAAIEIPVVVITNEFPVFKELFGKSLRLTALGDCFLTPAGELLANNPIAKVVINVDTEAMRVYAYFQEKRHVERETWKIFYKSRTKIAQELGVTMERLEKIVARLQARGVTDINLPAKHGV